MARSAKPERLKSEELALLRYLAQLGADRNPTVATSRELGERLSVSQQAADRYLLRLAELGLVSRSLKARRQELAVTPAGVARLRREYHSYRRIFEGPGKLELEGAIASGLGEGRYYLAQPGYVQQFAERLGYTPYPGTLNVRLAPPEVHRLAAVRDWQGIRIDGFEAGGRTFGGATCYVARLDARSCHLITPDRTHHTDVAEFISAEYLREALGVHDGDHVRVEVRES